MNKSKKIISAVLAVACVVPMMFGCSSTTSSSTGSSSSKESSSEAPKETVTLKVYTGDKAIGGLDRVTKAVNEYLKEQNTGLAIDWQTMSWNDLGQKSQTILSTGQKVDVMCSSSWLSSGFVSNAFNGYFTDLTPYITDENNKDLVDILGLSFLSKVNGKYYGLPTNKEKAHHFGFLYQKDEGDKLGITADNVKSLEDMEGYFDKAKADGYIPICAATMDHPFKLLDWDVIDGDGMIGALDPDDEKTIVDQFTADKSVAFFKKMKDWAGKGYFATDAATQDNQETAMGTGKYFCGSWSLMPGKDVSESATTKQTLAMIPITPVEASNRETLGALTVIPNASDHKDEAFQFLKLLYTDKKLINMVTYGVEGTDYTKDANDVITIAKDTDFSSAGGWIWGNQFNNYLTANDDSDKWDQISKYNDSAKVLDSCGFIFDKTNVKNEYANISKLVGDTYPSLFYGKVSDVDAAIADFQKKLDAAGEKKVLEEMQKQYDAFLAAK